MVVVSNVHEAQVVKPCNADAIMRGLGYCCVGNCLVTKEIGGFAVARCHVGDGVARSLFDGEPRVEGLRRVRFGRAKGGSWSNAHWEHVVLGRDGDNQDLITIAVVLPPQAHDVVGNCDLVEHLGKPPERDEVCVKSRDKDSIFEVDD